MGAGTWHIRPIGADQGEQVALPEEAGEGWWVRLRALTEAEALERESLGVHEEYFLAPQVLGEAAVEVRRRYDLVGMAEYDLRHCVLGFRLPEEMADGNVRARELDPAAPEGDCQFLLSAQPPLSDWLWEQIGRINYRQPAQRAAVELGKKD